GAVVVQRPVPLRERMPPAAGGDRRRLAEGRKGEADRRHEPNERDPHKRDVKRCRGGETDEPLAPCLCPDRDRRFERGHQATTFSVRKRRTFRIITGAISTSMITATAAP